MIKIDWTLKNIWWQFATLCFFMMLWVKPIYIHYLLIVAYISLIFFEYSMNKSLGIDTIVWYTIIICINMYWIYQYLIGKYEYIWEHKH